MECSQCGKCCTLFLINLTKEEYERLDVMFPVSFEEAIESDLNVLSQKEDGSCVYLTDGKCSIHDKRPLVCRNFFCDSDKQEFQSMIDKIKKIK